MRKMFAENILGFFIFFVAVLFSFTLPGLFILKKLSSKFTFWENLILGTSLGLCFFTLISYGLLVSNLPHLLPILVVIFAIGNCRYFFLLKKEAYFPPKKRLLIFITVFLIGLTGQLAIIAPSGFITEQGIVFWSSHGHDGSWHLALMEEIKKGFPLQNPTFANTRLVNYHFFSDIAPAMFNKYLNLSSLNLYFRFFPLLFSCLLGLLSFLIGKRMGNSFYCGIWTMIFTYFAGSFGYIYTLFRNHSIGGESLFWASQVQSSSGNPPQIAAFVILLTIFYLLNTLPRKSWLGLIILSSLAGSLVVFKVYAGVVTLGSLAIIGGWSFLKEKQTYFLKLFLFSAVISAILYLPNTSNSASFLIFEPWWYIRTMVVAENRLNWLDLELKRQTYLAENNFKRVIQVELTAFLIFLLGNLGMRFIGFISFWQSFKNFFKNAFDQLLILVTLSSFILPLLFLQKGVASNTSQFLQYFLLIFGIFAGLTTARLLNKIKQPALKLTLPLFIIGASSLTQLGLINEFYSRPPFAKISPAELQALQYLKKNTDLNSTILVPPYNKYFNLQQTTPPIWAWSDTAYIAAFSQRRTYLSDIEQVDIMGYDFKNRLSLQEKLFKETDPQIFQKRLKENNINYLYFPKLLQLPLNLNQSGLKLFYSNPEIEIWQVD